MPTANALRPQYLDEMIGQEKIRQKARIAISSAMHRGEPLGHCLLTSAGGGGGARPIRVSVGYFSVNAGANAELVSAYITSESEMLRLTQAVLDFLPIIMQKLEEFGAGASTTEEDIKNAVDQLLSDVSSE